MRHSASMNYSFYCWKPFYSEKTSSINSIATDALAPCVARKSATIVLNMEDKWGFDLHDKALKPPITSQVKTLYKKLHFIFPKLNSTWQGLKWLVKHAHQWCLLLTFSILPVSCLSSGALKDGMEVLGPLTSGDLVGIVSGLGRLV